MLKMKKLLIVVLSLTLIFSVFALPAHAAGDSATDQEPSRFTYINMAKSNMSLTGSTLQCRSTLNCYSNVTKIEISSTLQKKVLFWWTTEQTWVLSYYGDQYTFINTTTIGSGTYRLKSDFVAYSGSNSESTTVYSSELKKN